jgi:K+-sensing histidine kinase KdpD
MFYDPLPEWIFYVPIDNSIRHGTPVTSVTLSAKTVGNGPRIRYEDNGPGVPPDLKKNIFFRGFEKNTPGRSARSHKAGDIRKRALAPDPTVLMSEEGVFRREYR